MAGQTGFADIFHYHQSKAERKEQKQRHSEPGLPLPGKDDRQQAVGRVEQTGG